MPQLLKIIRVQVGFLLFAPTVPAGGSFTPSYKPILQLRNVMYAPDESNIIRCICLDCMRRVHVLVMERKKHETSNSVINSSVYP